MIREKFFTVDYCYKTPEYLSNLKKKIKYLFYFFKVLLVFYTLNRISLSEKKVEYFL